MPPSIVESVGVELDGPEGLVELQEINEITDTKAKTHFNRFFMKRSSIK
jgi:hypothetical protein